MRCTMFKANEIIYQNNDWVSFVFLFILVLLTAAKFIYNERITVLNSFFLSKNYFLLFFNKEKTFNTGGFQIILFIVQLLTLALLLYYVNIFFETSNALRGFNGFLIALLFISVYLVGRFIIGFLLSIIFGLKEVHKKIVFEKTNYISNLILWILPLLVLTEYMASYNLIIFKITLIFSIVLFVCRYVLLFINNKKLVYNDLFYFILYLCALEIAPLIIFIKLTI